MITDGLITLRAMEPSDAEAMYLWENDTALWSEGDNNTPFSRTTIRKFIDSATEDIYSSKQLRLIIELNKGTSLGSELNEVSSSGSELNKVALSGSGFNRVESLGSGLNEAVSLGGGDVPQTPETIGAIDLYDFNPLHRRAGVGILIYQNSLRNKGYGLRSVRLMSEYVFNTLNMKQLYAHVDINNVASIAMFHKAGFTDSGVLRQWQVDDSDVQIMQLIR